MVLKNTDDSFIAFPNVSVPTALSLR